MSKSLDPTLIKKYFRNQKPPKLKALEAQSLLILTFLLTTTVSQDRTKRETASTMKEQSTELRT